MALMIGCPTESDLVGEPDMAVVWIVAPVAVVVEILIADHIVRQILGRTRVVVTVIAVGAPGIEIVRGADVNHIDVQRVRSAEGASLSAAQGVGLTVAGGLA